MCERYIEHKKAKNFSEDYHLEKMIGKGSFGLVFKGIHKKTGEQFACKAEKIITSNKDRLRTEYNFYKIFRKRNIKYVPMVDTYVTTKEWNLMMMQLLGDSLDKKFADYDSQLDLGSVLKFGIDAIDGLSQIHRSGVIHRDIKPNNFMFGRSEERDSTNLYIVDFGLSKLWRDPKTKEHISHKQGRSMIGTARYSSINIHLGIEPSRRDDLESLIYVMIYLAKGRLPWQGLPKRKKGSAVDEIRDKKMTTSVASLCLGLPDCFVELLEYSKGLSFTESPDYDHMKKLIVKTAKIDSIDLEYAWSD